MVHVAVDARCVIRDDRGIGRYARAVLRRAIHAPGFRWTFVLSGWPSQRRKLAAALGAADLQTSRTVPIDADVLWFPSNGSSLPLRAPLVATIHDVVPFTDPSADARKRKNEQTPFLRTAAHAQHILVQSQFTASEVQRALGVSSARMTVTPLAADRIFTPGPVEELPSILRGRRYLLHVGAHDTRKNTATLALAFERAFANDRTMLAFTRPPPHVPRNAVVLDIAGDRALRDLYRGATLVCVPSTGEGFGLPLLEALACGAPVLASRAAALPEVGGDAVAWIDEPRNVDRWAQTLRTLTGDNGERARLATLGPARASGFSWEHCTTQTLAVFAELANAGGR